MVPKKEGEGAGPSQCLKIRGGVEGGGAHTYVVGIMCPPLEIELLKTQMDHPFKILPIFHNF